MRYCEESGEILLSVREMLVFSLFHYVGTAPEEGLLPIRRADAATRERLGYPREGVRLSGSFPSLGHTFRLEGEADRLEGEGRARVLSLLYLVAEDPEALSAETVRAARAEGYLLASLCEGKTPPRIEITYRNPDRGTAVTLTESVTPKKITSFFERAAAAVALYASSEIARVTKRLPQMRRLRFPYRERRLGQEELMSSVYRTVSRGERLYASAPTGIGKTVSTLYPAVRAMGEGKCDKIFYLTAKATAARMAAETAALLGGGGAVRAVLLASKERICPQHGRPCHEGIPCERSKRGGAREDAALSALIELDRPLIGPEEIGEVAGRFGVCPHELSLAYSMIADVVICDYNYLFDPAVRLARYFSLGGRFCFLIDEAHNLADRVRDTYSVSLSTAELSALRLPPPEEGEPAAEAEGARCELVSYLLGELAPTADPPREGEDATEVRRRLPDGLLLRLAALAEPLGKLMRDRKTEPDIRRHIRKFYYDLKTILDVFAAYDEGFRLSASRDAAGVVSFRTLCLDPAGVIFRALSDGRSAVLFSATLSPIEYYRDLLGGEPADAMLELPSPFERDNLAVAVMDKISTRYADREATLPAVAEAVAVTARARRGNYMVFCPSFAYADRLHRALSAIAPELRVISQARTMSAADRAAFLAEFERPEAPVLALCVLGGIWGEGVDLVGRRLIGAVIIGVGLGTPDPLREEMAAYFQEKSETGREYAYIYPGMNRVLQAAGRVIRDEGDVGAVVLIDDRFATPLYRHLLPPHWHSLTYVGNNRSLTEFLRRFWCRHPEEDSDEEK